MKLKYVCAIGFFSSFLCCFSALAETCPDIKDIVITVKTNCQYEAHNSAGTWMGTTEVQKINGKTECKSKVLSFQSVGLKTSGDLPLKGTISYCAYKISGAKKALHLSLKDEGKFWNIKLKPWKLKKKGNAMCQSADVKNCEFTPMPG